MDAPTIDQEPHSKPAADEPETRADRAFLPRQWSSSERFRRLGLELIMVFCGVFAAFTVENLREHAVEQRRTKQIYGAVRSEMTSMNGYLHMVDSLLTTNLAAFDSAYARGERPLPYYFRHQGSERPYSGAWEAALSAQSSVAAIDPSLLYNLTSYYEEQLGIADLYVRYATFTESEILPYLFGGPDHFYEPGTTHLRPLFAAHIERLRELHAYWRDGANRGDKLVAELEVQLAP